MESSRRDLSNDMAEHRPILKIPKIRTKSHFVFTPKTQIAFPKTGALFLLCTFYRIHKLDDYGISRLEESQI